MPELENIKEILNIALSIIGSVIVPIMLLLITFWVNRKSEERSRAYSDRVRKIERETAFKREVHASFNELYKALQFLRINNIHRSKHEEFGKQVLSNNDKIMRSESAEAKTMQQDLLKWNLDLMLQFDEKHATLLIEVETARVKLQGYLSEEFTTDLDKIIAKIISKASNPGAITESDISSFVHQINLMQKEVEMNAYTWLP